MVFALLIPRRCFRFSLSTLFVVLTVFGVWLAVQVNWIRERREILRRIPGEPADWVAAKAPWSIRIFGERGYHDLHFWRDLTREEYFRIKQLFPETDKIWVGGKTGPTGYMIGPPPE